VSIVTAWHQNICFTHGLDIIGISVLSAYCSENRKP
jgi:hypothetical protein